MLNSRLGVECRASGITQELPGRPGEIREGGSKGKSAIGAQSAAMKRINQKRWQRPQPGPSLPHAPG
eukprot:5824476-Karenia_brevis.AAC.1